MSELVERLLEPAELVTRQTRQDMELAAAEIKRLRTEVADWHECAEYDAMASGPFFKSWNRSALDRCRKRYIEGSD